MQPNKMGYFSYTQANVIAGKRDADQDVNEAKSLFQRTLQKQLCKKDSSFQTHMLPKEAKNRSEFVDLKETL